MSPKPVIPRALAVEDVDHAVDHYLSEAGVDVALGFVDALQAAYRHIAAHPDTGSPRYALELELPGLRCWAVSDYPYLLFYLNRDDHIDLWRVLHSARQIPHHMQRP